MDLQSLSSRAIIGEYYARLEQNTGAEWVMPISREFSSNQESEEYKWLGQVPTMREWIGGRQAKGLRDNGFTIKNKLFEATLEVLMDDIRRDKTGQILARVRELADRTNAHWAKLLAALINNGEAALCYDGQYFFDTDHSEGDSGSQSNLISTTAATGTAATAGEMETAILKSVETLLGFKDDQGEPMNEEAKSFLVLVPLNYMTPAAAALKNPVIIDGGQARTNTITNVGGFNFQLAVSARKTGTDSIDVFRTDSETPAFIRQVEQDVSVDAIAEGSELEFKERKHWYGVTAIRNVGYGYWQRAVRCKFT